MKKIKWITSVLVSLILIGWLYISYDNRDFLRHGVLRIEKNPNSLKLLDHDTYGASDFRAEYYFSIDSTDFNNVLTGRKYTIGSSNNGDFNAEATNTKHDSLQVTYCYSSGSMGNGLVHLYTNKEKTLVYIVYSVD